MKKSLLLIIAALALPICAEKGDIDFSNLDALKDLLGDDFSLNEANWNQYKRSGSTNPVTDVFYNIPLTNTKLSTTATSGVELKQSGRYYIANNFTRAIAANASYVLISGKNIVLDMNGCTIQGDLQTSSSTAKGISIANGLRNIRVLNGAVTGLQGDGINVGTGCDTIVLEKIRITNYQDNGVTFQGSSTKNITLSDVHVTTSSSPTSTAYGLNLAGTTTGLVENCSFNNSTSASGSVAAGAVITGCQDVTFKNCEANSNTGTVAAGYGFAMLTTASSGLKFVNCVANNNTSSTVGQAVGFYANVALSDSRFEGCEASSNSTGAHAAAAVGAAGFAFETTACPNNSFVNCVASGNTSATATAGSIVAGFALNITGSDNCRFDGCEATANSVTGALLGSICAGFYSTGNDNCRWNACKAIGNTNASVAGITCGFQLTGGGVSNVVNACEANGQYSSVDALTGRIVGIELGNSEKLSTVSNCTVVGNAYTTAAGGAAASCGVYGILLGTSGTGVDKCTVMKNTVRSTAMTLYNAAKTNTALAGLRDFTTDSTSLLSGNVLALNGFARLNIGSAPNYDIDAADLKADASSGGLNIYLTYDNGQNVADIVVETDVSNMQALSTGLEGWTNYLIVPQQA